MSENFNPEADNAFDANPDMWEEWANDAPEEAPAFEELPIGAYVIGKTATKENGKAAPEVRRFEKKADGSAFYKFSCGVLAVGGDAKIDQRIHNNKLCFFGAFIHPGDKETHGGPISGRLTGFLNACFARGIGDEFLPEKGDSKEEKKEKAAKRARKRWAEGTLAALRKVAESKPTIDGEAVTLGAYNGDKGLYFGSLACLALQEQGRLIIFKTAKDEYQGVVRATVGAVEDFTEGRAKNRKVTLFESEEKSEGTVEF